jgi:hypothetical protein
LNEFSGEKEFLIEQRLMKGKNKDFDLGEPVNLPPEFTIEESMLQE